MEVPDERTPLAALPGYRAARPPGCSSAGCSSAGCRAVYRRDRRAWLRQDHPDHGAAAAGLATSAEAGRAIIQQVAIGGPALPWADPALYTEMILSWEMRSYRIAQQAAGPVFFDRGVPDVIGSFMLMGLPVPPHVRAAVLAFR